MARLLPRSLLGQVMLVLALGLLVGQAISGVLLLRAAEQRRDATLINQIALRVVSADERGAERRAERAQLRNERRARRGLPPLPVSQDRPGIEASSASPLQPGERRLARYEDALHEVLAGQGLQPRSIAITTRLASEDPVVLARPRLQQRIDPVNWRELQIVVAGVERANGSGWIVVRQPLPPRGPRVIGGIFLQTLVIFAVLFALLYIVLRRMTRPLAELTARVGDFAHKPDQVVPLRESGPEDTRRLIAAHNAMEARVAALLDEKDVMLGAIGHDLKTPLAALRVRIESVPDEAQRQRMAESIEDITRTLDDILELARVGRHDVEFEVVDLAALASTLVEEFEDLEKPVSLGKTERTRREIQLTWLKRALRNLVENALRYGGSARLSVTSENRTVILAVEDDGPGIPPDQIAAMLEPFARGEASRNRATGGAGLGLTLARAIAEQHGGELVLTNRTEGGLRAEIRLPL
ncbi:two-component sensor histidine kinase [Altererythrobacter sp. BO-6]|uniref:ATP-binding protein n=1 Tax=Altererythrobacter sp. BO-6 TaxID=2604537 RepID=UPI0013E20363|nr:ATP-binding protein [Altererythrobacter sp. BO-6]QIG54067.1 two-component sensor histidine kinase [Altererythrobacter sp. BO-6]